jgi:hypothetical protein
MIRASLRFGELPCIFAVAEEGKMLTASIGQGRHRAYFPVAISRELAFHKISDFAQGYGRHRSDCRG